ncbi:MAG: hypothetical protein P9F19_04435 [Candidatus Contendobacter sp.]|nr:hypothetical protein [Candidatus Contendobacter sp.]MDG4556626.1 hypothetical protein [Candidatus Contendobacter sp.]
MTIRQHQQAFLPLFVGPDQDQRAKPVYKEHYLAECSIGKLKQFHPVFSCFDKTVPRFLNFIRFADAPI